MDSPRGKLHLRAVMIATVAMIATIVIFGMIADRAGSQGVTDHSDLEHHHGFTGPGSEQDWPPRPTGADVLNNVQDNFEPPASLASARGIDEPTTPEEDLLAAGGGGILAGQVPGAADADAGNADAGDADAGNADDGADDGDPAARALDDEAQAEPAEATPEPVVSTDPLAIALGTDWVRISYEEGRGGKDSYTPAEETYFSRSNNQTVIVHLWPGSTDITTYAPEELQPIVSEAERVTAAEIGRQWLSEQGMTDVEGLEGFAIRAFDGESFYPVRMVYVTYATSWFDDPAFSALIDMTNLTAVEGGRL